MVRPRRRLASMPRDRLEAYCLVGLWASLIEGLILAALAVGLAVGWIA